MPDDRPAPPSPSRDRPDRGGWQWRLMLTVLVGLSVGVGAAYLLGFGERGAQTGIVAGLTFAAGSSGRLRTALPVAAVLGVVVVVYSSLGAVTTGHAWAAALAMAFVAFTTSVMTAARPVGLLVGMVASYAYWLVTAVGVLRHTLVPGAAADVGVLGVLGLVVGLLLVALRALGEQLVGSAPPPTAERPAPPSLVGPIVASVRTFDGHARDGVRRALALGVAMFFFQTLATHNAFWVMLTVFVILGPAGRPSPLTAARRVVGTLAGVLAAVAVAQVLPWPAVLAISVAALALSLAASTRSTAVSAAFGAAAAAMLVALPSGDFLGYAAARLVDTVIGAAIAVVCGWLLWPGTSGDSSVPDGLAADASTTGISTT